MKNSKIEIYKSAFNQEEVFWSKFVGGGEGISVISCFVLKYFPYKLIFDLAAILAKKRGGEGISSV